MLAKSDAYKEPRIYALDRVLELKQTKTSFKLPKGYIKGSVGAGDAFCAGCLYAIYKGYDADWMLRYAAAAAAANLSQPDSVSGMKTDTELKKFMETWEVNTL